MNENLKYSILIPVYNSEAYLEELYNRICSVFESLPEMFEIVFVDDGSLDNTWLKLESLRDRDKKVKIIQFMRNYGQHNALMCGFHHTQGEYIITMDDDLQNPPEEIPKLIEKIKEGFDLVYGQYISKKHHFIRNIGSELIQATYKRVFNIRGNLTSFRIAKKQLIESILEYDKNYVFIDGLLAWNTKNVGYTPVQHNERQYGRSGYGFKKLLTLSLNLITNFSIFPLQVASGLGLIFALSGFFMAIFFLFKKFIYGIPVEGFTSLIIAISIFAGIQLLTLGLLGEYIGRIHLNINKKPQYQVRRKKL